MRMSIALEQLYVDGVRKQDAEQFLMDIAEQLEQLDAIIKNRTNHEISKLFQEQQQEMEKVETTIENLLQYR